MHPPTPLRQQPTVVMAADGQCPMWVSTALTNEDTCLEGFKEVDGDVQLDAKVTSNRNSGRRKMLGLLQLGGGGDRGQVQNKYFSLN